jgi:hypothetical protein
MSASGRPPKIITAQRITKGILFIKPVPAVAGENVPSFGSKKPGNLKSNGNVFEIRLKKSP